LAISTWANLVFFASAPTPHTPKELFCSLLGLWTLVTRLWTSPAPHTPKERARWSRISNLKFEIAAPNPFGARHLRGTRIGDVSISCLGQLSRPRVQNWVGTSFRRWLWRWGAISLISMGHKMRSGHRPPSFQFSVLLLFAPLRLRMIPPTTSPAARRASVPGSGTAETRRRRGRVGRVRRRPTRGETQPLEFSMSRDFPEAFMAPLRGCVGSLGHEERAL
jgi:hypothetical protein